MSHFNKFKNHLTFPFYMDELSYQLKIPKDRIAVLIGKDGEIKKRLEEETHTQISIDSKEGEVVVTGRDALLLYTCREIIRAIARGFNPEVAFQLLKSDYMFELVTLGDKITKSKNAMKRVKGRLIGTKGKTRHIIEEMTGCNVCVYGKTVGIIGSYDGVAIARKAIESIILGSPHSSVYSWLERRRKEQLRDYLLGRE